MKGRRGGYEKVYPRVVQKGDGDVDYEDGNEIDGWPSNDVVLPRGQ